MNKKRVKSICSLFIDGKTFLDIGTDHAFIPIFLLKNKFATNGFATEKNQGPFENAIQNIKHHELDHRMQIKLGNGIEPFSHLQSVDYLIITGLGTSTIINIIEDSKNKFWDKMILESTNDIVKLRKWIKNKNYFIEDEILIRESNKYNFILRVNKNKKTNIKKNIDIYLGPIMKNKRPINNELSISYLNDRINHYERIYNLSKKRNHLNELKNYKKVLKTIKKD